MSLPRVAVAVAAALLMIGSALPLAWSSPARKPLGQMTCTDFLLVDDAAKPEIVYWAAINGRGGPPRTDVIDVADTDGIVPMLIEKCKGAPKESFWPKVKAEARRFEKKL